MSSNRTPVRFVPPPLELGLTWGSRELDVVVNYNFLKNKDIVRYFTTARRYQKNLKKLLSDKQRWASDFAPGYDITFLPPTLVIQNLGYTYHVYQTQLGFQRTNELEDFESEKYEQYITTCMLVMSGELDALTYVLSSDKKQDQSLDKKKEQDKNLDKKKDSKLNGELPILPFYTPRNSEKPTHYTSLDFLVLRRDLNAIGYFLEHVKKEKIKVNAHLEFTSIQQAFAAVVNKAILNQDIDFLKMFFKEAIPLTSDRLLIIEKLKENNFLRSAFKAGNMDILLFLESIYGELSDRENSHTVSLLYEAARQGDEKVSQYTKMRKMQIHKYCNDSGHNLAYYAAKGGHIRLFTELVTTINLKQRDSEYKLSKKELDLFMAPNGASLLYAATDNFEMIKYLREHADLNFMAIYPADGRTLLHFAAVNKDPRVVEYLIDVCGLPIVGCIDNYGKTPLSYAAEYKNQETFDRLIAKGFRPTKYDLNFPQVDDDARPSSTPKKLEENSRNPNNGDSKSNENPQSINPYILETMPKIEMLNYSSFHVAAQIGNIAALSRFKEHLSSRKWQKIVDKNGSTLLHHAMSKNEVSKNMLHDLKKLTGIRWNHKNYEGITPFHLLVIRDSRDIESHFELVKDFVETTGENLNNHVASDGRTLSHMAAYRGYLDMLKYFINEPSLKIDKNYMTLINSLLHSAATYNQLEIMKFLVNEKKADVMSLNEDGYTAAHLAVICKAKECLYFLSQKSVAGDKGLEVYRSSAGETLLHAAIERGKKEMLIVLLREYKMNPDLHEPNSYIPLRKAVGCNNSTILMDILLFFKAGKNLTDMAWALMVISMNAGRDKFNKTYRDTKLLENILYNLKHCGECLFHQKVAERDTSFFRYLVEDKLIQNDNKEINSKSNDGTTPFHLAIEKWSLPDIKYLIKHYNPELAREDKEYTQQTMLLHRALLQRAVSSLEKTKFFIAYCNMDINKINAMIPSVLHNAVDYDCLDSLQYLVQEYRMDIRCLDHQERSLLQLARLKEKTNVIGWLETVMSDSAALQVSACQVGLFHHPTANQNTDAENDEDVVYTVNFHGFENHESAHTESAAVGSPK